MWSFTGVLAAPRDVFSCCSYRSLMWDLYISRLHQLLQFSGCCEVCLRSRVSCSSRSTVYSQRLSTPLARLVVRLMESWIALRNLEIFAHFTGVCRSIGHPFPMDSQGWCLRSELAILSAANTYFSGCCQGLHLDFCQGNCSFWKESSVLFLLPFSGRVLGSRSLRNTAPAIFLYCYGYV